MKKNNDTAPGGTLPNSTEPVTAVATSSSQPNHTNVKRYIAPVAILLVVIGLVAGGIYLHNRQVTNKRLNTLNIPTTAQSEKEIKKSSNLSADQRKLSTLSVAFSYLQEKKYDDTIRIARTFEKNDQYKEPAFCSLEVSAYKAKNDAVNLKKAAKSCLDIHKLKRTTDPSETASNFYVEATMYGYMNDHVNEKATYKQFIKFSDENNLSGSEDIGSLLKGVKEKYKNEI